MQVLKLMKISHISNMILVSSGNEEVSREQAVRVAIATELAGNPSVLFIDEPMKGLDSHASRHVMECLMVGLSMNVCYSTRDMCIMIKFHFMLCFQN